ncbi:coiled-coil domain-containing protein mad1 [Coemansia sp. RSA 353]|nr:coiled-coil domain-containing protein mad1 [Coemansia sp. RSA 521]KAJ2219809.1 coiled-coil domain-containing protein mad1 [Coemansia sp. RSA 520]KAJ2275094.1 coiled-coil domain-containing protein mad1 [Coemansia sp. RSA 371]KAJ2289707.1 coiled-coil domain-containing protein mad1 [Coemansia sp. RSA 355]KAJ2298476.1 coiled-coil domain-containing protein mad1 [Coemansia sp. RSA 353]KAJ2440638.1 coiled-coil domain-containing protein mad1 [Coemansia sp. RSA 2440]KAJ2713160.1 coiled-coil domain-
MVLSGAAGRRPGETPAPGTQANLPPSTVIRTRFKSITERPLTTVRGTKRYMLDDSPNGPTQPLWAALETPIRAPSQTMPLVDTILRPHRLFAHTPDTSPARSILEATHRGSDTVSRLEAYKRAAERAKFELKQVELERTRDQDAAQRTRLQLEAELQAQTKRVDKLERDRRWLAEQEERVEEQQRGVEAKLGEVRQKHRAEIEEAEEVRRELEMRVDDAARALHDARAEYVEQTEELQTRVANAERTIAELQAQRSHAEGVDPALQYTIDSLRRESEAKDHDIAELQQRLSALSSNNDATPSRTRVAQLERDLHEQCTYITAVEQQNRQLRADFRRISEQASKYEQEHEIRSSLEAKLQRLEAQHERCAEMEAQLGVLRQEREQWERVFQGTSAEAGDAGLCTPYAVAKTVAAQRHSIQMLESKLIDAQATAHASATELSEAKTEMQRIRQTSTKLEQDLTTERQRSKRLESTCAHAEREAVFLREQLHAYDAEEASMMENYDTQKAGRIKQLELFIDEQRAWIASLGDGPCVASSEAPASSVSTSLLQSYREDAERKQCELDALHDEHNQLTAQYKELQSEHEPLASRFNELQSEHEPLVNKFKELETEHTRLGQRFDALEAETARLELQVGAGLGYNPRTTRILQLIDNPSAQDFGIRTAKLAALSAENTALLERIRQLEASGLVQTESDAGSAFFQTIDNLRSENQLQATQLEESAKLISRLKREWKKKATELRDVVYLILGFRVDFLSNGSVRFTSTYAADVDQSFVFTSGDGDHADMRLLGGGSKTYLKGLGNDIRYWVQERGSIPGFMATVTLQNFEARSDSMAE